MENLTGKQLGAYRVTAPLGEGGMAAVYKAYQPGMDRYVALKILPRQYTSDETFVARFSREARLIANLEHPNILPVYDFGETDGYTYLVMRLVESGTLAQMMAGGRLSMAQVCHVITQVAGALDYAHSRGILHRDVKPSNVLVDPSSNCLLSDFGLAKMVEGSTHLTHTGGILGTPAYMAPEQALGRGVGAYSDVYALGVVLYELGTGRLPFLAETPMALLMKHIHDPLPPPRVHNPALPEEVERVILKSMAKDPADRYASAGEMARDLRTAAPAAMADFHGVTLPVRAPAPRRPDTGEAERAEAARAAREEAARVAREGQQAAEKRAVQRHAWGRVKNAGRWAYFCIGVAALLVVPSIVVLGLTAFGVGPKVKPNWAGVAAMVVVGLTFGYGGRRQLEERRRREAELRELAGREGNYYCCVCGTPIETYYWLHYVLCIFTFPWGLISLAFKLKKCQNCGRPYDSISRAAVAAVASPAAAARTAAAPKKRLKLFAIYILAAFFCAVVGAATQSSSKGFSQFMAFPFFVLGVLAFYQVAAAAWTAFKK